MANYNIQVPLVQGFCGLATSDGFRNSYSADDAPSHCHHSLEAEDWGRDDKYCGDGLLECGDEM